MKIQDLLFIIVFVVLLWRKKYSLLAPLGLGCLALAVPFFWRHIFFTAERLTWYAAAFFALCIIFSLRGSDKVQ